MAPIFFNLIFNHRASKGVMVLCLILSALAPRSVFGANELPSLLSNGTFDTDSSGAGWPDGWSHPAGGSWEKEGDARFLRLRSSKPGETVLVYRLLALPSPPPPALEIRLRVRYADIKRGKNAWFDGRVISHFKNTEGKVVKPEPSAPAFTGTSKGWVDKSYIVQVPATARSLELMPCLFQAESGTLDLARLEIFPATAEQLPKPEPVIPSATVTAATPAALPQALRVAGPQLLTKDGKPVWLQGLCVDSLEWAASGEKILTSIPVATEQWKANIIRLPVREHFWFGRGPWQKKGEGGMAYRKLVDAAIEAAAARGAYVALDLHRFGAPMAKDVEFWKDAAIRYKNHPAVLFELFNEPHGISWKIWRDGGSLKSAANKNTDVNAAENAEQDEGEISTGMQALLDAIRATGARNIVIAGGLDWGYDLSGVVKDFPLQEREGGSGIVYSSHIYPWKKDWQGKTLDAAAKYPVFIGEVGCPPDWKGFPFIPESGRTEDLTKPDWAQDMIGLIQKHKLHWTAFSFHPKSAPMVILDWEYTPTPYWGAFVKEALAGKLYEIKKMR